MTAVSPSLRRSAGAFATGGADALLHSETLAGLPPTGGATYGGSLEAEAGFGLRSPSMSTQGRRYTERNSDIVWLAEAHFRLAGCAFAGRESNPLDRYERFQLMSSSSPGLTLAQQLLRHGLTEQLRVSRPDSAASAP